MATITFYTDEITINDLSGSGLGFFGNSFGQSVRVGEFQDSTYITNAAGTTQGPQGDNVKYLSATGCYVNGAGPYHVRAIPAKDASLKIDFTNASAVKTSNAKWRIYDRVNINNNPSGVTCRCYEIIHPDPTATYIASGAATWSTPTGSSVVMSLADSPGPSGQYAGNGTGSQFSSTRHSWYLAISPSPDSVGSKTFAGYLSLEYA